MAKTKSKIERNANHWQPNGSKVNFLGDLPRLKICEVCAKRDSPCTMANSVTRERIYSRTSSCNRHVHALRRRLEFDLRHSTRLILDPLSLSYEIQSIHVKLIKYSDAKLLETPSIRKRGYPCFKYMKNQAYLRQGAINKQAIPIAVLHGLNDHPLQ